MSEAFLDKIKYLCNKIANVEWSGPLFYSIKGDISKPKTFQIILEDILPLDMGTKGYTEYNLDNRFIDYLMNKEERMDWNIGHIHSHGTFGVFFSGTDMSELNDNCGGHNFYLSLIVNNAMDFIAKIAFVGQVEKSITDIPYYANDNNGKKFIIQKKPFTIKKEKMFTYDCEILSPIIPEIIVSADFADKVAEIMKPKPKPVVVNTIKDYSNEWGEYKNGVWTTKPRVTTPQSIPSKIDDDELEKRKLANKIKHYQLDDSKLSERAKKAKNIIKNLPFEAFDDITNAFEHSPLEKFTIELMKFTTPLDKDENLEDILVDLEALGLDSYVIASGVMESYTALYDKHFPDSTDEEFITDTEIVVGILTEEAGAYPFINVAIEAIKAMIAEFEKDGTTV